MSDVEIVKDAVSRTFLRSGKEVIEDGEIQVFMTTKDDRIQDLISEVAKKLPDKKHDLVVTTPVTGNKNFFKFVNDQTMTPDELSPTQNAQ